MKTSALHDSAPSARVFGFLEHSLDARREATYRLLARLLDEAGWFDWLRGGAG